MKLEIPQDYVPSAGEINNIVYLCCSYTVGWPMRATDLAVCEMMRDKTLTGQAAIENLVQVACEYVWDHICGEPEEPSVEQLTDHMHSVMEKWYEHTTPEERADISPVAA